MGLLVVRRREKTAKFAPNSGVALGIGNSSRARVAARNERKRDDFRLFLHEFHYADLERNRKIRHDFWNSSHRIDTQYEVLARVCYALLNKKRGESLWNSKNRLIFSIAEYSAICTRFSFALWKLLPVQIAFFFFITLPEFPRFFSPLEAPRDPPGRVSPHPRERGVRESLEERESRFDSLLEAGWPRRRRLAVRFSEREVGVLSGGAGEAAGRRGGEE